jgi:coenzyme F420-0:L-glutamate ligase / coenzyme F420-1:gamma-L-glutamate ligase
VDEIRVIPIRGIPEVHPGDSISEVLLAAMARQRLKLSAEDILVIKHKIVSKSEGKLVRLDDVRPTAATRTWARRYGLDARSVELGLRESRRIVRRGHGVLITETRHGFICANSGVDVSNVDGGEHAVLLPDDPDASAARIHRDVRKRTGIAVPVIISDSFGRPWREGLTEVAIGCAGMRVFRDLRGKRDRYGYRLRVTLESVADELASAAGLVCEKFSQTPACLIRGFKYTPARGSAKKMIRPAERDLFR